MKYLKLLFGVTATALGTATPVLRGCCPWYHSWVPTGCVHLGNWTSSQQQSWVWFTFETEKPKFRSLNAVLHVWTPHWVNSHSDSASSRHFLLVDLNTFLALLTACLGAAWGTWTHSTQTSMCSKHLELNPACKEILPWTFVHYCCCKTCNQVLKSVSICIYCLPGFPTGWYMCWLPAYKIK